MTGRTGASTRVGSEGHRILLVGDVGTRGKATGTQHRFLATARGLSRVGMVDYLQWGARPWRGRTAPVTFPEPVPPLHSHLLLRRYALPDRLATADEVAWFLRASIPGGTARPPFAVSRAPLPRPATIDRWVDGIEDYDLVWCFELAAAYAMGRVLRPGAVPLALDVDAVPYAVEEAGDSARSTGFTMAAAFERFERTFRRRDRDAWRSWIERNARDAAVVAFSNAAEAEPFGLSNAALLPNGCDVRPFRGARSVSRRPVLSFVGWMGYEPNADAARYLVQQIVPVLRDLLESEFEVRLVGSAPPSIRELAADPNVVVAGYVEDLAGEFDRADVVVVPVRQGAGTRIKVLESFSNQVPVVSTTFGALGIDAVDGEHLLLGDDPRAFALACRTLLVDAELRNRLVANAHSLVATHHDWAVIEARVAELATGAMNGVPG